MRMVYWSDDDEVRAFAKKAAAVFGKHKDICTYHIGHIKAGALFAVRFGLDDDCVIVFKIDEDFEPINYQQLIRRYMEE